LVHQDFKVLQVQRLQVGLLVPRAHQVHLEPLVLLDLVDNLDRLDQQERLAYQAKPVLLGQWVDPEV
jgi:hypothetical protein